MRLTPVALVALMTVALGAAEQTAVPIDKGSYASGPPLDDAKFADKYAKKPFIHPSQAGKPVPTNDWWTHLVMNGPGGSLWAHPTIVKFDETGVSMSYSTGWSDKRGAKGSSVEQSIALEVRVAGSPVVAATKGKKPAVDPAQSLATSVLSWGDWTVVGRQERAGQHWDVTFGHGLPFMWVECSGLQPSLRSASPLEALKPDGTPFVGGVADALVVRIEGRLYGVFGPSGMTATPANGVIDLAFASAGGWIAVAALPELKDVALFRSAAGAVPRDSVYSWKHDQAKGVVTTTFELKTEALRPDAGKPLQGFIPHHMRTVHDITPVGPTFTTARGPLVLAQGTTWHLTYTFPGILPSFPVPKVVAGAEYPYDPARMAGYLAGLNDIRSSKEPANDTYWGGKDIQKVAQYAGFATRTSHPAAKALTDKLRGYLSDWFSFSGAGDKHYFAHYPEWKGLVGFPPSFGSNFFTDNHFHYGYFTMSAGLLGTLDQQFITDYGAMARLVAKQYANWDRADGAFPFLRTFDPWHGHSYAGGSSSPGGNNQESTSEAMNSWAGLVLLGTAMDDQEMIACGAMGWAVEAEAVQNYWYNYYAWKGEKAQSTWTPSFGKNLISILGDGGGGYATFFSGAPQHVCGIQWLPLSPALTYLGRDRAFTHYQFDATLKDMAAEKKPSTLSSIGDSWGNVLLGYLLLGDPAAAAARMDAMFAAGDKVATSAEAAGVPYFMAHAGVQIGTVAWDWHTSFATSTVFRKDATMTAVMWNPSTKPVQAQICRGSTVVKTVTVPARTLHNESVPAGN